MFGAKPAWISRNSPSSRTLVDDLVHVVGLVRRVGDQRVELGVGVGDLAAGRRASAGRAGGRRVVQVVRRQVGQQLPGEVQAVVLVRGLVVRDAGLDVVRVRAAELLEADLLAGHRLDHVGPGDEHVRGVLDHQREVGDRGGVDRAARARPHDQRDLRDHAGGDHVAVEDLGEQAERDHALLDPRAAAVVDADHRAAGLHRVVHHLDDLLAVHLAERAAEDGEVLAEHAHRPAVDGAVAGDHAVAVGPVGVHAEVGGAVPGQLVELGERARVEQPVDPLARGHLALGVLALHGRAAEPACTASSRRCPDRRACPRWCAGRIRLALRLVGRVRTSLLMRLRVAARGSRVRGGGRRGFRQRRLSRPASAGANEQGGRPAAAAAPCGATSGCSATCSAR